MADSGHISWAEQPTVIHTSFTLLYLITWRTSQVQKEDRYGAKVASTTTQVLTCNRQQHPALMVPQWRHSGHFTTGHQQGASSPAAHAPEDLSVGPAKHVEGQQAQQNQNANNHHANTNHCNLPFLAGGSKPNELRGLVRVE